MFSLVSNADAFRSFLYLSRAHLPHCVWSKCCKRTTTRPRSCDSTADCLWESFDWRSVDFPDLEVLVWQCDVSHIFLRSRDFHLRSRCRFRSRSSSEGSYSGCSGWRAWSGSAVAMNPFRRMDRWRFYSKMTLLVWSVPFMSQHLPQQKKRQLTSKFPTTQVTSSIAHVSNNRRFKQIHSAIWLLVSLYLVKRLNSNVYF